MAATNINIRTDSETKAQAAAVLVITEQEKKIPKAGFMKGKIWMADDFDAPLEDFKEYM
jgi:hypothetical protein